MAVYSEKLEKARKYEVENSADIFNTEKPSFHITPPVGWINDPNGFSCYKGEYHLFYQYHPYSTHWGPMHWGHVKSKDLITWEQLPCALAPDEEYDGQGCFSGTAIQDGDRHVLIYTSVVDKEQQDGTHLIRQTPVSYTHLDVYKRQTYLHGRNRHDADRQRRGRGHAA